MTKKKSKPRTRRLTAVYARQLDRLGYKMVGLRLEKPRRRGGQMTIILTVARSK